MSSIPLYFLSYSDCLQPVGYRGFSHLVGFPRYTLCLDIVHCFCTFHLVYTSYIRLWPNELVDPFLSHSSLLEPYQDSIIPGRIKQPPPPIELEDEVAAIPQSSMRLPPSSIPRLFATSSTIWLIG